MIFLTKSGLQKDLKTVKGDWQLCFSLLTSKNLDKLSKTRPLCQRIKMIENMSLGGWRDVLMDNCVGNQFLGLLKRLKLWKIKTSITIRENDVEANEGAHFPVNEGTGEGYTYFG